jgi:hypothetical protein
MLGPARPLTPKHQIKRPGEGRERRQTRLRTCPGKRQSKHLPYLQPSSGYRHELYFKQRTGAGVVGRVRTVKQSQSQLCSGWPLSQSKGLGRVLEELLSLLSLEGSNLVPMEHTSSRMQPHHYRLSSFGEWSVSQGSTVPYGKFQSLVIKMLAIIPVL